MGFFGTMYQHKHDVWLCIRRKTVLGCVHVDKFHIPRHTGGVLPTAYCHNDDLHVSLLHIYTFRASSASMLAKTYLPQVTQVPQHAVPRLSKIPCPQISLCLGH